MASFPEHLFDRLVIGRRKKMFCAILLLVHHFFEWVAAEYSFKLQTVILHSNTLQRRRFVVLFVSLWA